MSASRAPSTFAGATGVAEYHMRRYVGVQLTEPQAASLWSEVEADLVRIGLPETVEEAQTSESGKLDTLPRGDVLDALARVLTKGAHNWPANCTPERETTAFVNALRNEVRARNYAPAKE